MASISLKHQLKQGLCVRDLTNSCNTIKIIRVRAIRFEFLLFIFCVAVLADSESAHEVLADSPDCRCHTDVIVNRSLPTSQHRIATSSPHQGFNAIFFLCRRRRLSRSSSTASWTAFARPSSTRRTMRSRNPCNPEIRLAYSRRFLCRFAT
jgi:hypothetical protein